MAHKPHHHKTFITLILVLIIALGYIVGTGLEITGELMLIMLLVNTLLLVVIIHFILDIYSGNRSLEVVDVTPKRHSNLQEELLDEINLLKTEKSKGKKSAKKNTTTKNKALKKETPKKSVQKRPNNKKTSDKTNIKKKAVTKTTKKKVTKKKTKK